MRPFPLTNPELPDLDSEYFPRQLEAVEAPVEDEGGVAVVPSQSNAKTPRDTDWARYKGRNLVERFWSKAKQYRRVATRYEKMAQNFLAFVNVASIMILLR